jgi:hypothetical protein
MSTLLTLRNLFKLGYQIVGELAAFLVKVICKLPRIARGEKRTKNGESVWILDKIGLIQFYVRLLTPCAERTLREQAGSLGLYIQSPPTWANYMHVHIELVLIQLFKYYITNKRALNNFFAYIYGYK